MNQKNNEPEEPEPAEPAAPAEPAEPVRFLCEYTLPRASEAVVRRAVVDFDASCLPCRHGVDRVRRRGYRRLLSIASRRYGSRNRLPSLYLSRAGTWSRSHRYGCHAGWPLHGAHLDVRGLARPAGGVAAGTCRRLRARHLDHGRLADGIRGRGPRVQPDDVLGTADRACGNGTRRGRVSSADIRSVQPSNLRLQHALLLHVVAGVDGRAASGERLRSRLRFAVSTRSRAFC